MRLSKHFVLSEFTISTTASRHNIDNIPDNDVITRLKLLANNILEPIRDQFGPIHILSGYRSEELNKEIGGAKSSQHIFGEASDIISYNTSTYDMSIWANKNLSNFDQCIYEGRWLHISHSTRHLNRKVALTAIFSKNKHVKYISGIVDLTKKNT